jgi:hypothetical protein
VHEVTSGQAAVRLARAHDDIGVADRWRSRRLRACMFRSQVLNMVSTPSMLLFRFGTRCCSASGGPCSRRMMVPHVAGRNRSCSRACLYCVPFMYDVLLYQSLPPDEWLA